MPVLSRVATANITPLRLGFVCPHNPYDKRAFSGTAFFAAQALERHPAIALSILGNHRPPRQFDRILRRKTERIDPESLNFEGLDAIIGLVASSLIDQIETAADVPFLHVSDATPGFLRDCYGWSVSPEADDRERRTVTRAETCLYSSREMAERARQEYGIAAHAVPFGLNMATPVAKRVPKPPLRQLELLFVTSDWVRKGGEIAVATLDRLRASGVAAHLTVVGRLPTQYAHHPGITAVGYLNKNRPHHAAHLARLYARTHLMILPTRADCTPMVIPEAMAHGTPVLATQVGGIGSLLGGEGTGRTLPLEAGPAEWAQTICEMTKNADLYEMLSDAARDRAENHLNWDIWSNEVLSILQGTAIWPPLPESKASAA